MKKYNRNELNKIFQEELNTITVSEELKNKTLDKIKNQPSFSLYWLKNCAAVFLVTCICLSLYLHKNQYWNKTSHNQDCIEKSTRADISGATYRDYEIQEKALLKTSPSVESSSYFNSKEQSNTLNQNNISSKTDQLSKQENATADAIPMLNEVNSAEATPFSLPIILEDSDAKDSLEQIKVGDSEEYLLQLYPNIEKVENAYRLTTESQVILYQVENGIVTNIFTEN